MHKLKELRELLCGELDTFTRGGELSTGSLDAIDKLTHSIKSIDTIMAMQGHSNDGSYEGSYRRDAMGRYSRDYSRDGSYERGYSRDNDELLMKLRDMERTSHGEQKEMIERWIRQLAP